jgi:hypothetical protein
MEARDIITNKRRPHHTRSEERLTPEERRVQRKRGEEIITEERRRKNNRREEKRVQRLQQSAHTQPVRREIGNVTSSRRAAVTGEGCVCACVRVCAYLYVLG